MTTLGNHIRRLRFEHGEMTQASLAKAVGITRQTVIALEAERYAPSLELAMRISEEFNKPVDEIFFRRAAEETERRAPGSNHTPIAHKS